MLPIQQLEIQPLLYVYLNEPLDCSILPTFLVVDAITCKAYAAERHES